MSKGFPARALRGWFRPDGSRGIQSGWTSSAAGLSAQHLAYPDVELLLLTSNTLLMIGSIFLFIVGVAIYQGRSEFVGEDSAR